jgi:4-alpha-glucanotransferase
MTLKRQVLEQLAEKCFTRSSKHRAALETFLREHPHVRDYARFRAAVESRHGTWEQWPPRQRAGRLKRGDYSEAAERYYLYAQWQAHEQVAALARSARGRGVQLYLDLPLGTHRGGFDVWREQDLFALQASGGAPPDPVFTKGQDWGFAPLHPRRLREQGHRHFIEVVRHHLRHAGLLRIDHVMGLHRLYWVPQGLPASEGAYVSYPAEELYAILCLESHRHQAMIVGENLGTVPAAVNAALRRHRAREMFVAQYELKPSSSGGLRPVPARCVAGLNTHDMPPFRAFWEGLDIADRRELGLLDSKRARQEADRRRALKRALVALLMREQRLRGRNPDAGAVLRACLEHLGASDAEVLLVNLEDLWLETEAQNTPATTTERINWRRKAKLSLEELGKSAEIADVLRRVDSLRRRRKERK